MFSLDREIESDDKNEIECRICRLGPDPEDPEDEPMCQPCKCSGSIGYVHQTCQEQWLKHKNKALGTAKCELCSYQFLFEPIYKPNTPEVLSIAELFNAGIIELKTIIPNCLSYIVVFIIWGFILNVLFLDMSKNLL